MGFQMEYAGVTVKRLQQQSPAELQVYDKNPQRYAEDNVTQRQI